MCQYLCFSLGYWLTGTIGVAGLLLAIMIGGSLSAGFFLTHNASP